MHPATFYTDRLPFPSTTRRRNEQVNNTACDKRSSLPPILTPTRSKDRLRHSMRAMVPDYNESSFRNSPRIYVSEANAPDDDKSNNNNNKQKIEPTTNTQPNAPKRGVMKPDSTNVDNGLQKLDELATSAPTPPPPPPSLPNNLPHHQQLDYHHHNNKPEDAPRTQPQSSSSTTMYRRSPLSSLTSFDKDTSGFTPYNHSSSPFLKAVRKSKKRRGSIGEGSLQRQKTMSTPVEPRLTKSSTQAVTRRPLSSRLPPILPPSLLEEDLVEEAEVEKGGDNNNNYYHTTNTPISTTSTTTTSDMWDPHIDAFEVLRAKITGITRTMQEFHVQELFRDELTERKQKRERPYSMTAAAYQSRSMNLAGDSNLLPLFKRKSTATCGHPRRRAHGTLAFDLLPSNNSNGDGDDDNRQEQQEDRELRINSPPPPPPAPTADETRHHTATGSDAWTRLRTEEDFDADLRLQDPSDGEGEDSGVVDVESPPMPPSSPNLTALFLTTNSLINSRLDELSETASIASSCDLNNNSSSEWRSQFLDLVSACITQSEELESLSTEMLGTERRVRELMVLNGSVNDQYREREKAYEDRIRECEEVAKQQLIMIDTLQELTADLEIKMDLLKSRNYQPHHDADSGIEDDEQQQQLSEDGNDRWDFRQSVADIIGVEPMSDLVHKMRWEVGMFVGGGVGTGHVIHSFEGRLRGIEMMIAGTGTTVEEDHHTHEEADDENIESAHISHSLRRNKFHYHHYMLHLTPADRKTQFHMIPRAHWVPDQLASHCQFERGSNQNNTKRCSTQFSFFQRRHHCRRCGIVVCQRHSGNRLPLFPKPNSPPQWSRVCDRCFRELIMAN